MIQSQTKPKGLLGNKVGTQLRPYQKTAIKLVRESTNDAIMKMYCGTDLEHEIHYFCTDSPHTARVSEIATEMLDKTQNKVLICTYHMLSRLFLFVGAPFRYSPIDIAVFDESHHLAVPPIGLYKTRKLYFSATPILYENVPVLFEFNYKQALELGIVTRYSVIFALYEPRDPIEPIQLRVILQLATKFKRKRILVYNQNIEKCTMGKSSAKEISALQSNAQAQINYISAQNTPKQRRDILTWFCSASKNDPQPKILCNSGTVKEGVDLQCIDMIVFCDQKASIPAIIQALGRGTRTDPKNSKKDVFLLLLHPKIEKQVFFRKAIKVLDELRLVDPDASTPNQYEFFTKLRDCKACKGIFIDSLRLF